MRIYAYTVNALRRKDLPPLDHRMQRADLLEKIATQLRDRETIEYLHRVAKHLRVESDEEFMAKENLEALMKLFAQGPDKMSPEPPGFEVEQPAPSEESTAPFSSTFCTSESSH